MKTPPRLAKMPGVNRRGFALIVVMTLLALVVLMILSLVTMVQLALQASKASVRQAQAQQNALLAVSIGLAKLQEYAGPDMRSTGTADMGDLPALPVPPSTRTYSAYIFNPSQFNKKSYLARTDQPITGLQVPSVNGGTRYWTGVWGNSEPPGNIFKPTNTNPANPVTAQPVLLNWLVSGNEFVRGSFSNLTTGQITATPGRINATMGGNATFTPNMTVSNLTANATALSAGSLQINGAPAALLIGANTSGNFAPGGGPIVDPRRAVIAPLVNVPIPYGAAASGAPGGTQVAGRYAWWVGDEGVKASYNVTDQYKDNKDVITEPQSRYRFFSAPRFGIETVTGFDKYPVNNSTLSRLLSTSQILLANGLDAGNISGLTALQGRYHDLTLNSKGVLANSQRGGLREDLTTLFEQSTLPAALTGNILPDGGLRWGSNTTTPNVSPRAAMAIDTPAGSPAPLGLKWDLLFNYYKSAIPYSNVTPIDISTSTGTKIGVSPVITQVRLVFSFHPGADNQIYIATQVAFVLSNPYSFAIKAPGSGTNGTGNGLDLSFSLDGGPLRINTGSEWGIMILSRPTDQNGARTNNFTRNNLNIRNNEYVSNNNADSYGYLSILKNDNLGSGGDNTNGRTVLGNVNFRIAGGTLWQPGQSKSFMLSGPDIKFPLPLAYRPNVPRSAPQINPDETTTVIPGAKNVAALQGNGGNLTISSPADSSPTSATGPTADTYFTQWMGPMTGVGSPEWGYLCAVLPSKACTLEMRIGGNPAGRQVVQRIVNMDLTGAAVSGSVSAQPVPQSGFRHAYDRNYPTPKVLAGYYSWLALADSPAVTLWYSVPDSGGGVDTRNETFNFTDRTNYRTFADFNLRAMNLALPPAAPFNQLPKYSEFNRYDPGEGLPTVPPFLRIYDQGSDPDPGGTEITPGIEASRVRFSKDLLTPKWGHTIDPATGQNNVILFDLPRRNGVNDLPIISMGQLRHVSLGADDDLLFPGYQPGNPIGNSYASPFISRNYSVESRLRRSSVNHIPLSGNVNVYDISYLLNTALWDRYYFSSLLQGNATPGTAINPRLKFLAGYSPTPTELGIGTAITAPVTDLDTGQPMPRELAPARYQMIDGSFNINSTSVEAWKAVLSSLRGVPLYNDSDAPLNPIKNTRISRVMPSRSLTSPTPSATSGIAQPSDGKQIDDGKNARSYAGFRRLTDDQINALAERIVEQVRLRGPFLSLGQFVNRKLAPITNPLSMSGALQSAIDNTRLNGQFDSTGRLTGNFSDIINPLPGASAPVSLFSKAVYPEMDASKYTTSTQIGQLANSPGPNDTAAFQVTRSELSNRSTGIPGWVTQADLLEALGPIISARSDTFVIRAYGESLDALDGVIQGRAWCEAVVQRYPDYVDTADAPTDAPFGTDTQIANKLFGRQFRIVSFRWLNPQEI